MFKYSNYILQSKTINRVVYLMLAILLVVSCTTTGHFTSNPQGKMAHAGTEFILTKSDSFQINSWTDHFSIQIDADGNRIWNDSRYRGRGVYKKKRDSLHLRFTNSDSITIKIDFSTDSLSDVYKVSFFDELGDTYNCLFIVTNEEGEILRKVFWPNDHRYTLNFKQGEHPFLLSLEGFGVNVGKPSIKFSELKKGLNTIKLKSYNGYFSNNQTLTIWFKPTPTGIRYTFNGRKRYLPRKWGIKAINKLYRDY